MGLLKSERKSIKSALSGEAGEKAAKWILLAATHLAPPVIYIDSPLSFLAEGKARAFYQGMGGLNSDEYEDPTVINYYVIEPRYESREDEDGSPVAPRHNINTGIQEPRGADSDSMSHLSQMHVHYGTRLVGMIPCSDAFGVDLLTDKYAAKVTARRASHKKMDDLMDHMGRSQVIEQNEGGAVDKYVGYRA